MSAYQKQISGLEYEKRDIYAEQNEKSEGRTWEDIREEKRRLQLFTKKQEKRFF